MQTEYFFLFQNKIPPYESRITTAKLLIEAAEYEVRFYMICGLCVCVCARVVEFSFIVNNSGSWRARVALYSLWSTASIIKEWYLLRRTAVMGVGGQRG